MIKPGDRGKPPPSRGLPCFPCFPRADRQRKFDGLGERSPQLFIGILLGVLQLSLLILVYALCRHMWTINTSLAS